MKKALPIVACLWLYPFTIHAEDTVVRTAAVPNRLLRQGEARLVRGPRFVAVQIKLHTRHLAKVRDAIAESESATWPDSPDSARYLHALDTSCAQALRAHSGKIHFEIEWRLRANGTGRVRISGGDEDHVLDNLSPDYLKHNLALIMADRFDFSKAEALAWIHTHLAGERE